MLLRRQVYRRARGNVGFALYRCARSRGAVLLEGILSITFIMIPLLFGIAEYSSVAYEQGRLRNALAEAGRSAAGSVSVISKTGQPFTDVPQFMAQVDKADLKMIDALRAGMTDQQLSRVQRLVIFDASVNKTPAQACLNYEGGTTAGLISAKCNVYLTADLHRATGASESNWETYPNKASWPAISGTTFVRKSDVDDAAVIGVYLSYRQPATTGLFGSSFTLTNTFVYRKDPQPFPSVIATSSSSTSVTTICADCTPTSSGTNTTKGSGNGQEFS